MSDFEFHPLANLFPLMDGAAFDELVSDIQEHGLREPIILHEAQILDGRNRYRACQALDIEPNTREWSGEGDAVAYVVSLNLKRRHLDESQRSYVAAKLETLRHGDNQHTETGDANLHLHRDAAASLLNVSTRSVASAATVRDHGSPELREAVESGAVKVSTAADIATLPEHEQGQIVARGEKEILQAAKRIRAERAEKRRAERDKKLVALSNANAPLVTDRRYPIIYADPPWEYEHSVSVSRDIENHYPTMSLEDICALPLTAIATEDAMLFLWVPPPILENGFQVIGAWGFRYLTQLVWDKEKIGMGYYARQQHENVLVARRGSAIVPDPSTLSPSVVSSPRGEHSAKPEVFYEILERMYPTLPRIELFARQARDGWDAWGNQADAA